MTQTLRPRAKELYERMAGGVLYREAAEEGMSLTRWLEKVDPSDPQERASGLDAFGRIMRESGVVVRSVPEFGVWADEFGAFDKDPNARALVPEWINRQVRAVTLGGQRPRVNNAEQLRQFFLSADNIPGGVARPFYDDGAPTIQQITPQIPLASLVARTSGITGDTYRAMYLTRVTADLQTVRVAEAAEIPRSKLTGGDHVIKLHKYGRALETSYEQLRRIKIDLVGTFLQLMATQMEIDRVGAALDVLVNGDGNANTAGTVYALTTLDPAASAGTLTLKGYLSFKMKFLNPYTMTTMIAQEASALQAFLLSTGSANIPLVFIQGPSAFGGFSHINPGLADNVRVGWIASAPSLKLVGFDNRMALEHVTEVGGDISEVERYVSRQTQELTITTIDGFRTLDPNAVNILNINA